MKPINPAAHDDGTTMQREILLFTDTSFSNRQYCSLENHNDDCTAFQHLERACWAGLLADMLPELDLHSLHREMFTWHILPAQHFLWISQGTNPGTVETQTSIDPYFFLLSCSLN